MADMHMKIHMQQCIDVLVYVCKSYCQGYANFFWFEIRTNVGHYFECMLFAYSLTNSGLCVCVCVCARGSSKLVMK